MKGKGIRVFGKMDWNSGVMVSLDGAILAPVIFNQSVALVEYPKLGYGSHDLLIQNLLKYGIAEHKPEG